MKKITWIFLLTAIGFQNLYSQGSKEKIIELLTSVNRTYSEASSIKMEVTHKFYNQHNDRIPADVFRGYYIQENSKVHSLLMGVETIQNKNHKLVLDTSSKTVIVSNPENSVGGMPQNLEQSLKFCSAFTLVDSTDSKIISLFFDKNRFPFERLVIAVSGEKLRKVTMYHAESLENNKGTLIKPKTEIIFENPEFDISVSESEFSTNHVIEKTNGSFVLTQKYSTYLLSNILTKSAEK